MAEMRWYNSLVARLMEEQRISEYALARDAGVSTTAVRSARTGHHYISMETLEKILLALGFKIEPVPFFSPVVLLVKDKIPVVKTKPEKPVIVQQPVDADSYCWGCGKPGTLRNVHGHWQCSHCGYIDPCCDI